MLNKKVLFSLFLFLTFSFAKAQSIESLREKIYSILVNKSATVGVAIKGTHPQDTLSINGNKHLPMQSVFKFHLVLALLRQVDQGKFSLDEKIKIDQKSIELYKYLWSPLREKYPDGAEITLAELIKYTVALSDNLGCDLLFNLLGGTKVLQAYLEEIGVKDITILHTEIVMQALWSRQYENWTTANASNQVLQLFYENANSLLSNESYHFLLETLKNTRTGKKSIRGLLPKNAVVAHKTGYSGKNDKGLTGALNDIGIVFLPKGSYFYLSIYVSDSMEDDEINQKIVAEITKLAWDYFNSN